MKKPQTPQRQFKNGTAPQEHVMPHGMDNREANSPEKMRKRNSLQLGTQTTARPGLAGMQGRNSPKRSSRGR